jgi:hypothetical protein
MLVGQVGRNRKIDTVFDKTLRVLGHGQFLEPSSNPKLVKSLPVLATTL